MANRRLSFPCIKSAISWRVRCTNPEAASEIGKLLKMGNRRQQFFYFFDFHIISLIRDSS